MKKVTLLTKIAAILMVLFVFNTKAQQVTFAMPDVTQVFGIDSLNGFDEDLAKQAAFDGGFFGSEFKVFMWRAKKDYIKAKYDIRDYDLENSAFMKGGNSTIQAAACNNEDFEGSAAGAITTSGQIAGWTLMSGSCSGQSNAACTLAGCCANQPTAAQLYNVPGGLVDPNIGACYPIFSVFGSGAQNAGTAANASNIPNGCYGTNFIRINDGVANYSMHRLSKTIAVTPANAVFMFAFISVFYTGHDCCNAGAFQIRVLDGCGSNSVMTCPTFSASAPSSQCVNTSTNAPTYLTCCNNANNVYNKWKQATLDLTAKIGCNVTIEIVTTDCTGGAHYGYVYFDAQCAPIDVIGNGNTFPAGTPKITLPTCGAAGANITAPTGLGPYLWQGPGSWIANPSYTAQTVLNVPGGTYTLTMTPPGACAPITRTIVVVNTPSPSIVATVTQVTCNNPISKASATLAGSAAIPGNTVVWSPAPGFTNQVGGITSATNLPTGTGTVTVTDTAGCTASAIYSINASPIVPTVGISFAPTNVITCAIPQIQLTANGGPASIAANLTYSWTSACGNATGAVITVTTGPCNYQVFATDPNSGCVATATMLVTKDVTVSAAGITPGNQVIQCGVIPNTYTGTPAPQSNYTYQWFLPCGPPLAGYICSPGCVGVYTFEVTNALNGCKSTKTVQVTSNPAVPTLTVSAQANNYYVTCVTCVTMQITGGITGGGGLGVRWMDQTMTSTLTTSNTYSTCVPGNYVAYVYDLAAPNCSVAQMVTVLSNTTLPNAGFTSLTWGPMQSPTLTCNNPCVILTGTSTATSYSVAWNIPAAVTDVTLSVCSTTNQATTTVSTPSVVITDLVNGCVKKLPVPVYQDIKTVTLTAKATPSLLTCKVLQSQLQYTPNPLAALHTWTWTTPSPGTQISQVNPLDVFAPGTYTVDATNTVNGCKSTQTVVVGLNNLPPAFGPVPDGTIACGSPTAQISSGVTSTVGMQYFWTESPLGAAFSPNAQSGTPGVTLPGVYEVLMTNTITGCQSTNSVVVVTGTLTAEFLPDPATGYAPLNVNFTNQTNPAGGTSLWSYGNGITATVTPDGSTQYTSPGTYTVLLISTKGVCVDSAVHIVFVDIPSKLEVPNVFTPNGDGINDNFILHTANLTDITVTVVDRWGVKMYEVTTDKGNIAWDGKTLGGHAASTGTYFWMIKATGKDGKTYDDKGIVTLYK